MNTPTSLLQDHRGIVCLATERKPRHTEAALFVRSPGRYLLATSVFHESAADNADASIEFRETEDGGETWSMPVYTLTKHSGINVMAPSILRLSDGSVGMLYLAKQSLMHGRLCWRRSFDNGATWSEPRTVAEDGSYLICLNDCAIVMQSGRILFPVFSARQAWAKDEHYRAWALYSDDLGETWHWSANSIDCPGRGSMEPVVYETLDHRAVMMIRTDQGRIWESESADGGVTWGEARPTLLESPQAPCMVKRIPGTESLLLARNPYHQPDIPAGGPRIPLVLDLSHDDGRTWREQVFVLEESTQKTFSYPTMAFDGESVLLTYYVTRYCGALCDTPDLRISLCFRKLPLAAVLGA